MRHWKTTHFFSLDYRSDCQLEFLSLFFSLCGCFGNSFVKGAKERKAMRLSFLSCGNNDRIQGRGWGKTDRCTAICVFVIEQRGIIVWLLAFSLSVYASLDILALACSQRELKQNLKYTISYQHNLSLILHLYPPASPSGISLNKTAIAALIFPC